MAGYDRVFEYNDLLKCNLKFELQTFESSEISYLQEI
jgi:hypothetical protein